MSIAILSGFDVNARIDVGNIAGFQISTVSEGSYGDTMKGELGHGHKIEGGGCMRCGTGQTPFFGRR